jgi:outer membrane protein assembly factor BamE (lipoprotein component of BamABCDE complex)
MAKSEVEAIMGSPSTTASVNLQGDSYYYISSVTTQRSFLDPQEQTREIIAIRFRPQRPGHQRRAVRPRGRTHHQHAGPQDTPWSGRNSASSTSCSAARVALSAA